MTGELTRLLDVGYRAVDGCAARDGYGAVGHDVIEDDGVKGCAGLRALAAQALIDADAEHGSRGYSDGLTGLLCAVGLGLVGVLLRRLRILTLRGIGGLLLRRIWGLLAVLSLLRVLRRLLRIGVRIFRRTGPVVGGTLGGWSGRLLLSRRGGAVRHRGAVQRRGRGSPPRGLVLRFVCGE